MYTEFTPQPYRYEGPWAPAPVTEPPPPPPDGPGTFSVVLRVLAVLGLVFGLCATGAGLVFRQQIKDVVQARQTTVVTPDSVLGRLRLTDPDAAAAVEQMLNPMRSGPGVTGAVGGIYRAPDRRETLIVLAVSGRMAEPDQALAGMVSGLAGAGVKVTELVPVAAGPLGGSAECGKAELPGPVTAGACLWVDSGSFGLIMLGPSTANQVAGEYTQIRALFERR